MSIVKGPPINIPIPEDLTVVQFILDTVIHPSKPNRDGIPWLIDDVSGRKIGYEEIRTRVYGLANGLSPRWNIKEDDTVCVFAPNHVDYGVAIWACGRLGAVVSPANPAYTVEELVHQLKTSKSRYIITISSAIPVVTAAASQYGISKERIITLDSAPGFLSVDDVINEGLESEPNFRERRLTPGESKTKLAFLCFSSGTTGPPKAVAISHYSVIANVIQLSLAHKVTEPYTAWSDMRYRPGYVTMAVLPFFHIYGLVVLLSWYLHSGLTLVIMPKFDFVQMLESIVRHRITHLAIVPPQAVLIAKHPLVKNYDLSHVKLVSSGAAPFSSELLGDLAKVFPKAEIGQGYGMTETVTVVSVWPIEQRYFKTGSSGTLLPGFEVKLVRPDGTVVVKRGDEGEILVRSPSLSLGYYGNPEATAESFVDGWLKTGDVGYFDDSGELYITDRIKEFLKVKAFQVAPAELEGHLLGHPAVADVCVVGIKDEYSGELPKAYIVLETKVAESVKDDDAAIEQLKQVLKKHVSDHKVAYKRLAGGIEFIDVIPKSASGKLLRRVLRDRARQEQGGSESPVKPKL